MEIQVKWLGHSGFQIKAGDHSIVIDPFLTGNPLATVEAGEVEADYIILSHGHGDHVGDTVAIAQRTGATVLGNFEVANWIAAQGVENTHGLNAGGGVQLPFGRVELTLAFHSSSMPDGSYGGQPNGILIFMDGGPTLYHAGDTTVFMDMQLIGQRGIDLAMLPIGDYFTMGPDLSLQAIEYVKPQVVLPMHYNTFPPIAQDAAKWAQRVQNETAARPVVLDPGGTFTL